MKRHCHEKKMRKMKHGNQGRKEYFKEKRVFLKNKYLKVMKYLTEEEHLLTDTDTLEMIQTSIFY